MPFKPWVAATAPLPSPIERLNAVALGPVHFQYALQLLARLPAELRGNPLAQAVALEAFAEDEGLVDDSAPAALHARLTALAKWTAAHNAAVMLIKISDVRLNALACGVAHRWIVAISVTMAGIRMTISSSRMANHGSPIDCSAR